MDRRRAPREAIETAVVIHTAGGERILATARNISTSGMLLDVQQPSKLKVGEEVTVDVELPDNPLTAFAAWGIGKIVRIDGCRFGIQIDAGTFEK